MGIEPERPVEKLLRAYARKRRDAAGAPLGLHPATRRMLQSEVAQKLAPAQREPAGSFWRLRARFWPGFAWGLAAVFVVALSATLLKPTWHQGGGKERMLAQNQPSGGTAPPATAPQPFAPAPGRPENRAQQLVAADAAKALTERDKPVLDREARQAGVKKDQDVASGRTMLGQELAGLTPSAQTKEKAAESASAGETPASRLALAQNEAVGQGSGAAPVPTPAPAAFAVPARGAAAGNLAWSAGQTATTGDSLKLSMSDQGAVALKAAANALALAPPSGTTVSNLEFQLSSLKSQVAGGPSRVPSLVAPTTNSVVQRFARAEAVSAVQARLADKVAPAGAVLVSFQVEQTGRELRIVDNDGSVYAGYVQAEPALSRLRAVKDEPTSAARALTAPETKLEEHLAPVDAGNQPMQSYLFSVVGTNRTLNEKVVFTGSLLAPTNATSFKRLTNAWSDAAGFRAGLAEPAPLPALPLLNARISGKALIGDGKEIEVDAAPAKP